MGRARLAAFGMVALAASVLCFKLGTWQLRRHAERRGLNEARAAALALPTVDFDTIGGVLDAWRRVRVTGVFDDARQLIVVNRPVDGRPGVVVVTPLRLRDGTAVLVERGWVPTADATAVDLSTMAEAGARTVIGVTLPVNDASGRGRIGGARWPALVTAVTPIGLQHRFPYRLRANVVQALPGGEVPGGLQRLDVAAATPGPHFGYAIQWFAFAAIFAVGFGAYAWRYGGPGRAPNVPSPEVGEDATV